MAKQTRREFLESSMFATLAAAAANAGINQITCAAEEGSSSPNERLRVAVLGVHNRGRSHIRGFMPRKDCEIAAIVDPDETIGMTKGVRSSGIATALILRNQRNPVPRLHPNAMMPSTAPVIRRLRNHELKG